MDEAHGRYSAEGKGHKDSVGGLVHWCVSVCVCVCVLAHVYIVTAGMKVTGD